MLREVDKLQFNIDAFLARKVYLKHFGELRLLRDVLRVLGCNRRGSAHHQGAR